VASRAKPGCDTILSGVAIAGTFVFSFFLLMQNA